jgi:diguanylate cyclase (GGDEF)-like protein/PAS domain S-box-containing protein
VSINNSEHFQSPASLNILVVIAESQARKTVESRLLDAGYNNFTSVNSSRAGLEVLRIASVDLLIVDVDMPDLDGWRLSRLVRSGILLCDAAMPIIMVTSTWCERIAEVTAREYGINRLVPLDQNELIPSVIREVKHSRHSSAPKPRLLVIEDEQDTSDLIVRLLSPTFEIETANNGELGLAAWKKGKQDLVLLDIMMPIMSGDQVLQEIQQLDPKQPVVIMTAHTTLDQAEELMFMGAVDFIPKPFRSDQLRNVCDIAIHREDYMVSNAQFAQRVQSLRERELEFRHLYESYHQLLDDLQSVVMELDSEFTISFLNRAWEQMMGYPITDCVGQSIEAFISAEDINQFTLYKSRVNKAIQLNKPCPEVELSMTNSKHQKLWARFKVSRSTNDNKKTSLTVCLDNITEQRETQEKLKYLAMHDSLTGLYNRHFFETTLAQLTDDSLRHNRLHGLVYLDLDHFKIINDTFGHQKGDEVLREMSNLLRKRIRGADILCRLGGDEFAILLRNVSGAVAMEFARNIQKVISEFSFQIHEQRVNLGGSIGLTIIDGSTNNPGEHLKRADIALYVAKGRGRNLIHQYDPTDNESEQLRHSINMSQKVRKAIAENRMTLYFQPIYDPKKKSVSYYESLVRLMEPDGKIIPPGHFIPALESIGEMYLLDRWIIKLAIETLKNHPELKHIAINLSAQAFKDDSLLPTINENLKATGVSPERLTFELTESASLFNLQITKRVISELHRLGCSFSVDDFGSGFSSFSYLKELPADFIKLDGSFIKNLHKDPVDQTLVKSMIQVIQALGKNAVAEFVENQQILDLLIEMGIDYVQGFHIGHPKPVHELAFKKETV